MNSSIEPLTGVRSRSKCLEHIEISSIDNYRSMERDKFIYCTEQIGSYPIRPIADNCTRKCVYMYEDKYTFSRILQQNMLVFNSHFECGNLHSAHLITAKNEMHCRANHSFYDLYMHEDLNSSAGTAQWFYFSVSCMKANQAVTFSIRNFSKPDSLFSEGMRPLMLSTEMSERGWVRCGTNISYLPETESTEANNRQTNCRPSSFVLSFTHVFEHSDDTCYFAYAHPYTYTDLQNHLAEKEGSLAAAGADYLYRGELCKTLAGNVCDLLTICPGARDGVPVDSSKPQILLTARVHPGETSSSWIMQGVLDFLLSEDPEAADLRDMCVFKVVPMLNPDGVINGNNRTSLSGHDLNRVWDAPSIEKHPTIFHCKELARVAQSSGGGLRLYLDLHGHSRQRGVFVYGCLPDMSVGVDPVPGSRGLVRSVSAGRAPAGTSSATERELFAFGRKFSADESSTRRVRRSSSGIRQQSTNSSIGIAQSGRPPRARRSTRARNENNKDDSRDSQRRLPLPPTPPPPSQQPIPPLPPQSQLIQLNAPAARSGKGERAAREGRVRRLPDIMSMHVPGFSKRACSYKLPLAKMSTSRAVVALELGVECAYTVEASMGGSSEHLFHPSDLIEVGQGLCKSIRQWLHETATSSSADTSTCADSNSCVDTDGDYDVDSTVPLAEVESQMNEVLTVDADNYEPQVDATVLPPAVRVIVSAGKSKSAVPDSVKLSKSPVKKSSHKCRTKQATVVGVDTEGKSTKKSPKGGGSRIRERTMGRQKKNMQQPPVALKIVAIGTKESPRDRSRKVKPTVNSKDDAGTNSHSLSRSDSVRRGQGPVGSSVNQRSGSNGGSSSRILSANSLELSACSLPVVGSTRANTSFHAPHIHQS